MQFLMEWLDRARATSKNKSLFRTALTICALTGLFAVPITNTFAAEKPKSEVADLRYGVALYNYYQQEYIPAITELMIADARDGIHGHSNNPELIAGGISLAFGMQKHAEELFSHLLEDNNRPQNVRDAAWFYLGKLQYARGDWQVLPPALVASVKNLIQICLLKCIPCKLIYKSNKMMWPVSA